MSRVSKFIGEPFHATMARCVVQSGSHIDGEVLREAIVVCRHCGEAALFWYHDWNDFIKYWAQWAELHRAAYRSLAL